MKIENLLEVVYKFYPQGIDCIKDKKNYLLSGQYKKLQFQIRKQQRGGKNDNLQEFLLQFQKIGKGMNFYDATLFRWQDRCYTFELSEQQEKTTNKIRFHKSILVPYFMINSFKIEEYNDRSKFTLLSFEDLDESYKKKLVQIKDMAEKTLFIKEFNREIIDCLIEDVNFEDIEIGRFTFFNAFFLNSTY